MKHINITSGEYLNNYLKTNQQGVFISFNEAMIQGDLLYPLFDKRFIEKRALLHNVKKEEYEEKLHEFLNITSFSNQIEKITLWFGCDAFCIINLLTVLTYLDQIGYDKEIFVNIVDDETNKVISNNHKVSINNIKEIYLSLSNRKQILTNVDFIDKGIQDYLYITSDNNFVIDYIKQNKDKLTKKELLYNLLNQTKSYGLSDTFLLSVINKRVNLWKKDLNY